MLSSVTNEEVKMTSAACAASQLGISFTAMSVCVYFFLLVKQTRSHVLYKELADTDFSPGSNNGAAAVVFLIYSYCMNVQHPATHYMSMKGIHSLYLSYP